MIRFAKYRLDLNRSSSGAVLALAGLVKLSKTDAVETVKNKLRNKFGTLTAVIICQPSQQPTIQAAVAPADLTSHQFDLPADKPILLFDESYNYTEVAPDANSWIRLKIDGGSFAILPLIKEDVKNAPVSPPTTTSLLPSNEDASTPALESTPALASTPSTEAATKQFSTKIAVPSFNRETDSIEDRLDELKRIIHLTGEANTKPIILLFLQQSDLSQLLTSLSLTELQDFNAFRDAMIERFASRNKFKSFSELRQRVNEDAYDWRERLERHYNRLRGSTGSFTPSDIQMLRERHIQGLHDPTIRLRVREEHTPYADIPTRVRNLHNAKRDEAASTFIEDQISNLTQQVAALSTSQACIHCGYGHASAECRASSKTRAAHNRRRNSGRPQRKNYNFYIPNIYTRGNPRPPPRNKNNHPSAFYPNSRRVTFQPRTPSSNGRYRRDRSFEGDRFRRSRSPYYGNNRSQQNSYPRMSRMSRIFPEKTIFWLTTSQPAISILNQHQRSRDASNADLF